MNETNPGNELKTGGPSEEPGTTTPKVQRAVEKLADQGRITSEIMMAMGSSIGVNPLHNKMTPEHISKVLDLGAAHDEREFTLAREQQQIDSQRDVRTHRYGLAFFAIVVLLVGFLAVLFRSNPAVLLPLLTAIGGLVSGFLAGMGYAKSSRSMERHRA